MPDWRGALHDRLRGTPIDPAREAEIVEELSAHLDDRFRELTAEGLGDREADRAVMRELESLTIPPRVYRAALPLGSKEGRNLMANIWHDVKVAVRILRGKPAFTLTAIFMLAIGIAGNAAIFSIFNGLFLRPLPFPEPERLVDLDETAPKWNLTRVGISNPDYDAWQKGASTFEGMAFTQTGGANLWQPGVAAQRIDTAQVTWNMLRVLRLKPALGRDFAPGDDRPNGPRVALLGYGLWMRLFNRDPQIVGRTIQFNEQPWTVIGVLPREAVVPPKAQVWFPLQADVTKPGAFYLGGIGRLKPGVTMQQALADLLRVHKARPGFADAEAYPIVGAVRDRYLSDFKAVTRILLGAVGMVLVIACVNIAALMLVRGESRSREIAIRTAIGASRARIVRQLLTESMLLAAAGGASGIGLGAVFLAGLVSLMPSDLPQWVRFTADAPFAIFCAAVTGAAAIAFGVFPALQAARVDTRGGLQETARSTLTGGKRRALSALVVFEVATALVLLVSSGLLVQAFRKVLHTDPGFRPDNTLTWSLRLPPTKYDKNEKTYALFHGLVERLRALPGVTAASAASIVPLDGHTGYFFQVEGGRSFGPKEQTPVVLHVTALAGYFEAMGIQLRAGRGFETRDEQQGAPRVLVVNETFARHFWGTTDVIGKYAHYPNDKKENWMQVIGVVRDMRHYGIDREVRPEAFASFRVLPARSMTMVVRSGMDPRSLAGPAREAVAALDPGLPMFDVRTMTERVERSLWVRRAYSWLFAAFAVVAILLAAAGIYGVISFSVTQRTREIGIRVALGARPSQVMREVLRSGMALVAIGAVLGLAGAQFTAGLLQTLLFDVSARDVATYAVVIGAVAAAGLAANYLPARRAAGIEPVKALRAE